MACIDGNNIIRLSDQMLVLICPHHLARALCQATLETALDDGVPLLDQIGADTGNDIRWQDGCELLIVTNEQHFTASGSIERRGGVLFVEGTAAPPHLLEQFIRSQR